MSAADRPDSADGPTGLRGTVDRISRPVIVALSRQSPFLPFVVMLVLIVVGLFLGGVAGFVLLVLVVALMGWLLYLGWPAYALPDRLMRLAVILLVAAVAVTKIA